MKIETIVNKGKQELDKISRIKIDSSHGIETVFLSNRFSPQKEDIKRYCFDNKLLNKKEAEILSKKSNIPMPENSDKYDFFIYHKSLGIITFQKGDYIITEDGYITTNGENVLCYDNEGNELGSF